MASGTAGVFWICYTFPGVLPSAELTQFGKAAWCQIRMNSSGRTGLLSEAVAADRTATFNVASCLAAAKAGHLEDWIHVYLAAGPWANVGLSNGLRRQQRWWTGPLLLRLDALVRCCGPEPEMEYRTEAEGWRRKVSGIASYLTDQMQLPPLIVEWRMDHLSVRDGSHRHAAAKLAGWTACWAVVWHNNPADDDVVRRAISDAKPRALNSGQALGLGARRAS